jgi:hypothetical protein
MAKKSTAATADTKTTDETGGDELLDLVHEIGRMLKGLDPVKANQVLDALKVLYPSKLTAKSSSNGPGYMP